MGWCVDVGVEVAYVQPIAVIEGHARFAALCLKRRPHPTRSGLSNTNITYTKMALHPSLELPGEAEEDFFSEDEVEVQHEGLDEEDRAAVERQEEELRRDAQTNLLLLSKEERELYDKIKAAADDETSFNMGGGTEKRLVQQAFTAAVKRFLPENGELFEFEYDLYGGALWGECGKGAEQQHAYLKYKPSHTCAGGSCDVGRGDVNVPFGNKLTPVSVPSQGERVMIDAAFAVIVEKLGLTATGPAGLYLISQANAG